MKEGINRPNKVGEQLELNLQPVDPIAEYAVFLDIPADLREELERQIALKISHSQELEPYEIRFQAMLEENEKDFHKGDNYAHEDFTRVVYRGHRKNIRPDLLKKNKKTIHRHRK